MTILFSQHGGEEEGAWVHSRGMLKFGRPDLSIHQVRPDDFDSIVEMFNRFIAFQALGHLIPDGQEVRMAGLPQGMACRHGGDHDDADFNNVHVEIRWPHGATALVLNDENDRS